MFSLRGLRGQLIFVDPGGLSSIPLMESFGAALDGSAA